MDTFEANKQDRLHQSLSSAWASFLSAQHCSREVNALRTALDEHVQKTNLSITSLQRETTSQHNLLATAVAESKSKIEQHAAELKETIALQNALSALREEINQDREHAARKARALSEKVEAQQESLTGLWSIVSRDMTAIQGQYRLALEEVGSLRGELKEVRVEKVTSDQRLATLESRFNAMTQAPQELSGDMPRFLDDVPSPRDDLTRLIEDQGVEISVPNPAPSSGPVRIPLSQISVVSQRGVPHEQLPARSIHDDQHGNGKDNVTAVAVKRKPEGYIHSQPKRPTPPSKPSQDIRSLYLHFKDRYKADPPKSDTAFIWEFISSIDNQSLSKHIQESLAAILPEYVTSSRDTRRRNPQRHVDISKGLTWRKFREALVKIPGPS